MEKCNFLKELKRTTLEFLDGMYTMFCAFLVFMGAIYFQTKTQTGALNTIINTQDWSVIFLLIVGIFVLGIGLRYIVTSVFKLIIFLFKLIFKK